MWEEHSSLKLKLQKKRHFLTRGEHASQHTPPESAPPGANAPPARGDSANYLALGEQSYLAWGEWDSRSQRESESDCRGEHNNPARREHASLFWECVLPARAESATRALGESTINPCGEVMRPERVTTLRGWSATLPHQERHVLSRGVVPARRSRALHARVSCTLPERESCALPASRGFALFPRAGVAFSPRESSRVRRSVALSATWRE